MREMLYSSPYALHRGLLGNSHGRTNTRHDQNQAQHCASAHVNPPAQEQRHPLSTDHASSLPSTPAGLVAAYEAWRATRPVLRGSEFGPVVPHASVSQPEAAAAAASSAGVPVSLGASRPGT
jgi:hypothetical protein